MKTGIKFVAQFSFINWLCSIVGCCVQRWGVRTGCQDDHLRVYVMGYTVKHPQTNGFRVKSNTFWMILGFPMWRNFYFFFGHRLSQTSHVRYPFLINTSLSAPGKNEPKGSRGPPLFHMVHSLFHMVSLGLQQKKPATFQRMFHDPPGFRLRAHRNPQWFLWRLHFGFLMLSRVECSAGIWMLLFHGFS